jgi:hypothetical protein
LVAFHVRRFAPGRLKPSILTMNDAKIGILCVWWINVDKFMENGTGTVINWVILKYWQVVNVKTGLRVIIAKMELGY